MGSWYQLPISLHQKPTTSYDITHYNSYDITPTITPTISVHATQCSLCTLPADPEAYRIALPRLSVCTPSLPPHTLSTQHQVRPWLYYPSLNTLLQITDNPEPLQGRHVQSCIILPRASFSPPAGLDEALLCVCVVEGVSSLAMLMPLFPGVVKLPHSAGLPWGT